MKAEDIRKLEKEPDLCDEDGTPKVIACDREDGYGLKMWCRYCQKWHWHGIGEGHRAAHCYGDTPYSKTGYILVPTEGAKCG